MSTEKLITQLGKISFKHSELKMKFRNLEGNGFELYLDVREDNYRHSIYTNTRPGSIYNGAVCDVYYSKNDCYLIYSKQ